MKISAESGERVCEERERKKCELQIEKVLNELKDDDLLKKRNVQIYNESGLSILVHVIEHFSYHTGQITWYTKYLKDIDTGYYGGINLEVK